jgi:hypothetical protein
MDNGIQNNEKNIIELIAINNLFISFFSKFLDIAKYNNKNKNNNTLINIDI